MGEIAKIGTGDYTPAQLKVIQANNPDLQPHELNTFVEMARATGLNLFRRQLSAIVFSKNDTKKRRVAFVIGIDGYRAMADRTGTYMPSDRQPSIDRAAAVSDINPLGIEAVTVYVKKWAHGAWHEFAGTARWEEFAPVEVAWAEDETGKRRPTDKRKLADNWRKMPLVMISKVAESQALRKGWPDTMAGVYTEEEVEKERVLDLTATEIIEEVNAEERLRKIGGANAVVFDWLDGSALDRVPDGKFADRLLGWLRGKDRTVNEIEVLQSRNKASFQEYWARNGNDALELKKAMEERVAALRKEEAKA